jgi:hypothetical protein
MYKRMEGFSHNGGRLHLCGDRNCDPGGENEAASNFVLAMHDLGPRLYAAADLSEGKQGCESRWPTPVVSCEVVDDNWGVLLPKRHAVLIGQLARLRLFVAASLLWRIFFSLNQNEQSKANENIRGKVLVV